MNPWVRKRDQRKQRKQKHIHPVNLHPLFLFSKLVWDCDPDKTQVQNMGCGKQGTRNRVIVIKKEAASSLFE